MTNNFHQEYCEEPESFCKNQKGYYFDDNQLLKLLFKQLKNEQCIAEVSVSATGEIDHVLLNQVFQQRVESMICC